ncbi:MAG: alpha/beta hydrolase [Deltaproteobacteria bacterium]|nr:alpha/beta hydrolase [Deltaproteobacteria bacterium]
MNTQLFCLLTGAALFAAQSAQAADTQANPFGLVYRGAITKNEPGQVNIHPVTYKLRDIEVAANVYTPANYDAARKYPAVVVAHPNGGVKEQVAGLYAQRLAERGYITITADAAYQGASSGEPRNVDRPAFRIDDIRGMADYIGQYPGVDSNKLALLGICGGGGYSLKAAQTDKRFKAVATLSMFDSGRVRRNGFLDADKANIQKRLQDASKARAEYAATGKPVYLGSKPGKMTAEELAKIPTDLYRDGMEYYGDTHAHPNSTFAYTADSLLDLMEFDATSNMDLIDQPLLIMAGEKADTLYMSEDAFNKATGTTNKKLFKIPGATHIRTYWFPEYVDQALNKLGEFYGKNL